MNPRQAKENEVKRVRAMYYQSQYELVEKENNIQAFTLLVAILLREIDTLKKAQGAKNNG